MALKEKLSFGTAKAGEKYVPYSRKGEEREKTVNLEHVRSTYHCVRSGQSFASWVQK